MKKVCTICFIERGGKILLGKKKRGFGMGRWNGFGGKVEGEESIFESLRREAREELSLQINEGDVEKVAELHFKVMDNNDWAEIEAHVFWGTCSDEPVESEELLPEWFAKDAIPYEEMWIDDPLWLPQVIAGKKVIGHFKLTESNTLSESKVEEVKSFE